MEHFIRHFLAGGNHILHYFAEALCTVFVKLRIGFGCIAFKHGTMTFEDLFDPVNKCMLVGL